ncbi:hypothetical protein SCOCK_270014 [Actinacidiphila cocklensis]|uniref:Uncharacterized protein n=1 Tax=Actinacidiphila cocklensis TaxID=887465 RepID=A0A9W4DQV6_9ACTN|nr:hypothetical protein SCOCK_270014 [Actinacidiphila cocklensis]
MRTPGRLAQRESTSFTPKGSLVRSQYRPPGPRVPETVQTVSGTLGVSRHTPGASAHTGPYGLESLPIPQHLAAGLTARRRLPGPGAPRLLPPVVAADPRGPADRRHHRSAPLPLRPALRPGGHRPLHPPGPRAPDPPSRSGR